MVVSLKKRRDFCEESIVNKEGRRFSLDGRDWVTDEFWNPAGSWRVVANDKENLCDDCRQNVWQLVRWEFGHQQKYSCDQCAGCHIVPILVVILNLPRREGKTFNTAAFTISEICLQRNRNVLFLATSGDQNKMLFEDNWETPIKSSPILRKMCTIVGERISVKHTGSQFRYAKTSAANSVAGGGVSMLVLDECRGLHPKAALSAIGSTRDQGGKECTAGCKVNIANTPNSPDYCPACDAPLEPWFPLILMTSSSGIETGSDLDWFQNLVDSQTGAQEGFPVANVHTFRMQESANPVVQGTVTNAYDALFGQSDILRPYVDVEMHNTVRRLGEDFVSPASIRAVTDRRLGNYEASEDRCVAFLDTSTTGDLTSLVVLAEDIDRCLEEAFEYTYLCKIVRWDPGKEHNGVIDPERVKKEVVKTLHRFPNLVHLGVDVRGSITWAGKMVQELRQEGYKNIYEYGNRGARERPDRDTAWSLLEQRILNRRIRLPDDAGLFRELRGVQKKVRKDGTYEVRDRNRRMVHADVAEGLAACCLLAFREANRSTLNLSDLNESKVRSGTIGRRRKNRFISAATLKSEDLI